MEGWQRCILLSMLGLTVKRVYCSIFSLENEGRVRILSKARGRRSPLKGALQPFTPLLIRLGGRGEIKSSVMLEPISLV